MKQATLILPLAALALATPALAGPAPSPEARLAKLLEGRVAGKPVDCIDPRVNSSTQVIEKTAIVYGSGHTIYVQRPTNAEVLSRDDVLVTDLRGSGQLCTVDVVRLHDRTGGWYRGFVNLTKFVPYTRVAAGK
jgi:hypothetical protein